MSLLDTNENCSCQFILVKGRPIYNSTFHSSFYPTRISKHSISNKQKKANVLKITNSTLADVCIKSEKHKENQNQNTNRATWISGSRKVTGDPIPYCHQEELVCMTYSIRPHVSKQQMVDYLYWILCVCSLVSQLTICRTRAIDSPNNNGTTSIHPLVIIQSLEEWNPCTSSQSCR